MNFEEILKDASKEEGAGQFVLFDDNNKMVGQYHTTAEVIASVQEHQIKCPALFDINILKKRSYFFDGKRVHVIEHH
jgi:hypothetical protein